MGAGLKEGLALSFIIFLAYVSLYLAVGDVFRPYNSMFAVVLIWKCSLLGGLLIRQVIRNCLLSGPANAYWPYVMATNKV